MKKYVIYKTTNRENGKSYIGFHGVALQTPVLDCASSSSIFPDGYLGSGTLILKAIKKYGKTGFDQELLAVFDSKEEAEMHEQFLVDKAFTLDEENYNLNIGGNVRIAYGENNGFHGKSHSDEFKEWMSNFRKGKNFRVARGDFVIVDLLTGVEYTHIGAYKAAHPDVTRNKMVHLVGEGKIRFVNEQSQASFLAAYSALLSPDERARRLAQLSRERFTGTRRSDEANRKTGDGVRQWIADHPEEHKARMEKINKNPDKIEKMAEKHRGMKRSEAACKNISESLRGRKLSDECKEKIRQKFTGRPATWLKGKICFHYPETKHRVMILPTETPPEGYLRGQGPKKRKTI